MYPGDQAITYAIPAVTIIAISKLCSLVDTTTACRHSTTTSQCQYSIRIYNLICPKLKHIKSTTGWCTCTWEAEALLDQLRRTSSHDDSSRTSTGLRPCHDLLHPWFCGCCLHPHHPCGLASVPFLTVTEHHLSWCGSCTAADMLAPLKVTSDMKG